MILRQVFFFAQGAAAALLFSGYLSAFMLIAVLLSLVRAPWALLLLAFLYDLAFWDPYHGVYILPASLLILAVYLSSGYIKRKFLW